jgi:DNA mismatch repair protein MutL
VRFADPRAVNDALYAVLSRALSTAFSLPPSRRAGWNAPRAAAPPTEPTPPDAVLEPQPSADPWGLAASDASSTGADASYPEPAEPAFVAVQDVAAAPIRPRPELRWANLRFVAQVRHTYLVCEADDGLYVLDQHAAAERVMFDKLRKAYRASAVSSQALLFPVMVEVTPAEAELVEARAKEIAAVGLDLRVRGPETLSVHAVPKLLQKASPERMVRDLLAEVLRTGGRGFSDAVDLALATMACHASIRAGDPLSAGEATALLSALDQADFAGHCPHGRPVVTHTSWAELDRRVGRR